MPRGFRGVLNICEAEMTIDGQGVSGRTSLMMRPVRPRWLIMGVLFVAFLMAFFGSYYTVRETERAVLTQFGQFVAVKGPGLHFKIPFVQGVVDFPVNIRAFQVDKVNTYTVDNQELDALFTVNYRIPNDSVENVFKRVPDYEQRLISLAIDRFKAEVGRVNVSEIASKRGEVRDRIFKVFKENANALFQLEIVDFQITNVDFNKTFREANNEASKAKAGVEQADNERRRAVITADRARIDAAGAANAAEESARGAANARLLAARAEAEAIRIQGEAQALAIRAQAEALASNLSLIELRKAERWDGKLPTSMLSNVMPFMNVDQQVRGVTAAAR